MVIGWWNVILIGRSNSMTVPFAHAERSAGVSAGIDVALTLLARIHGPQRAQLVQHAIEYDLRPPFDAGSPSKAPAQMAGYVRSLLTTPLCPLHRAGSGAPTQMRAESGPARTNNAPGRSQVGPPPSRRSSSWRQPSQRSPPSPCPRLPPGPATVWVSPRS